MDYVRDVWHNRLQSCFHPFHPWTHTLSHIHTHTHRGGVRYTKPDTRAPHVVRQTEIAAPSPAVLINPSLSEAAPLRPGAVITSLHLLHLQPSPLRYELIHKGWQPFRWPSWVQASIQQVSKSSVVLEQLTFCQISDWPGATISLLCVAGHAVSYFLSRSSSPNLSCTPLVRTDSWCGGLKGRGGSLVSVRRGSADPPRGVCDLVDRRAEECNTPHTADRQPLHTLRLSDSADWHHQHQTRAASPTGKRNLCLLSISSSLLHHLLASPVRSYMAHLCKSITLR